MSDIKLFPIGNTPIKDRIGLAVERFSHSLTEPELETFVGVRFPCRSRVHTMNK